VHMSRRGGSGRQSWPPSPVLCEHQHLVRKKSQMARLNYERENRQSNMRRKGTTRNEFSYGRRRKRSKHHKTSISVTKPKMSKPKVVRSKTKDMWRMARGLPVTKADHVLWKRATTKKQRNKLSALIKARYQKRKAVDAKRKAVELRKRKAAQLRSRREARERAAHKRQWAAYQKPYTDYLAKLAEIVTQFSTPGWRTLSNGQPIEGVPLSTVENHVKTIDLNFDNGKSLESHLADAGFRYISAKKGDLKARVLTLKSA
jgi:hypothetical protein